MNINMNGIYTISDKLTVKEACKKYRPNRVGMEYHCMNWTFYPREYRGQMFMVDTYWSSGSFMIEVNKSNIQDFQLIAVKDDIEGIYESDVQYYNSSDVIWLAMDSSGELAPYVNKDAKMSSEISIKVLRSEIDYLYSKIEDKNLITYINLTSYVQP